MSSDWHVKGHSPVNNKLQTFNPNPAIACSRPQIPTELPGNTSLRDILKCSRRFLRIRSSIAGCVQPMVVLRLSCSWCAHPSTSFSRVAARRTDSVLQQRRKIGYGGGKKRRSHDASQFASGHQLIKASNRVRWPNLV